MKMIHENEWIRTNMKRKDVMEYTIIYNKDYEYTPLPDNNNNMKD